MSTFRAAPAASGSVSQIAHSVGRMRVSTPGIRFSAIRFTSASEGFSGIPGKGPKPVTRTAARRLRVAAAPDVGAVGAGRDGTVAAA